MRLVLDTNVIVSALLIEGSLPDQLIGRWRRGRFDLLICPVQIEQLARVTRYPKLRSRLTPALAGRLINQPRKLAVMLDDLPAITVCADPSDNYLLATAMAGRADFLVTGDKAQLPSLKQYATTRIVTVRALIDGGG